MSIVITTPTGNVGSRVAARLLAEGESVTLVARSKEKVADLAEKGARVIEGSHQDPALLTEATRGAASLYLATPPNLQSDDIVAFYKTFGEAAAAAIQTNKIPYVVHLSSIGADLTSGTGPILGLHHNEKILNDVAANITHLRPCYFMENTLMQLPTVGSMGQMFTPMSGDKLFPMIATQDIAERAAALLRNRDWTGSRIVELMGPEEMSYNRVARILTDVLGRDVSHVTVPSSALAESVRNMGGSEHMAGAFVEMTEGIESGRIRFRSTIAPDRRTPTPYRTFAETVFKSALAASAG